MRISKQEEKQCRCPCFLHTNCNHCRVRIEGSDQLRCKNEYHNTDQLRQQCCHENSKPCALFCALMLFCTQILADKGGHCHCETGNRQKPNPSILEKAPTPAIAISPNELMLDCTTTLASAIIEFCTPDADQIEQSV